MAGGKVSLRDEERELAARLRRLRRSIGLSQEEVAGALGVVRSVMSAIENGRRKVSGFELRRLARVYQVDVGWLLTGESVTAADAPDILSGVSHRLSPEDKKELLRYAEFLAARGQRDAQPPA